MIIYFAYLQFLLLIYIFQTNVCENKLFQTVSVREKLNRELRKITLVENDVVVNHEVFETSTTSPETLHVVKSQQYWERDLLHITNATYAFFLLLEQEHVDRINLSKLVDDLQKNMIDDSIEKVSRNKTLYSF